MNIDWSLAQRKALTKSCEQMGPNQGSSNVHLLTEKTSPHH